MSILHITKHSHHLLTSVFLRHELIDSITLSHTVSGYMRCSNAMMPTWFGATENENVNCCVCGIGAEPIIIIIVVAMAAKIRGQKCKKRAKNTFEKMGLWRPWL